MLGLFGWFQFGFVVIVWHSMAWNGMKYTTNHTLAVKKIYTANKINGYENKDIKFIATTMRGKFIIN